MKTYEAYVRTPNGMVVKACVHAECTMDAINLLRGMYGQDNLVHLPSEV